MKKITPNETSKYALETKIACLRNEKVYVQDDKELYNEIQKEIDNYVEIFDKLYGKENYMKGD